MKVVHKNMLDRDRVIHTIDLDQLPGTRIKVCTDDGAEYDLYPTSGGGVGLRLVEKGPENHFDSMTVTPKAANDIVVGLLRSPS